MDTNTESRIKRVKPIRKLINVLAWLCSKWLALTTSLFIAPMVAGRVPSTWGEEEKWACILIACLFVFFLIDFGNVWLLKFYQKEKILAADKEQKNKNQNKKTTLEHNAWQQALVLILFVFLLRIGLSFASTWNATPDVAETITEDKASQYGKVAAALSMSNINSKEKAIDFYQKQLDTKDARLANAKAKGHKEYLAAYNKGTSYQKASIDKNEIGWLLSRANKDNRAEPKHGKKYGNQEYGRIVKSAIDSKTKLVNAEIKATNVATEQLRKLSQANTDSKEVEKYIALANMEARKADAKIARRGNYLYVGDICALLLLLLFTRISTLIEISEKDYSVVKSPIAKWSMKKPKLKSPFSIVPDEDDVYPVKKNRGNKNHNGHSNKKEPLFP